VSGVTRAQAAAVARAPIRAPSSTVAPFPIRHSSPSDAAWIVQLWPTVEPAPISVPPRGVTWTTEQSCTLAPRRTTIGLKSPRRTALYQTDARSSIVTSPTTTAVGATNAVGCTFGRLPSKLNSGMGWTPAVSSKLALILLERDATGGGNAVSEDRGCRHGDASSSVHAGAPARARQPRLRGATRILSPQRHRRPSSVDRSGNLPA